MSAHSKIMEAFKEEYPDAVKAINTDLPNPLIEDLVIIVFVDSYHAHNKVTRRSITGLIILVGRTPVFCYSKIQGTMDTSTYSAEFMAM